MLEVCIDSFESALNAIHGGADELEVCSSLAEGGLTPSAGLVKQILNAIGNVSSSKPISERCPPFCSCLGLVKKPKVNVMLRCRTGSDFCYTQDEIDTMKTDLHILKSFKVDRFVFGALTDTQNIDEDNCKQILEMAKPLPLTFHRAFDVSRDPDMSLFTIIELGFDRVLTSGKQTTVANQDALNLIHNLSRAYFGRIDIMPGSGVNASNVSYLIGIGIKIVHSSCKVKRKVIKNEFTLSMGTNDSEHIYVTDTQLVKELKEIISAQSWVS